MGDFQAELVLHVFHREVLRDAGAGRGIAELALVLLHILDQFGNGLHRQVRIDHQDERRLHVERDRDEVVIGIVGDLLEEREIDRHRGGGRHKERVPVGLRLRHRVRRQHQRSAGAVFHHDRLAQALRQPVGIEPHQHVHAAAGRKRHDDGHRTIGVLRLRGDQPGE
jgi:hypothetical protein